MKKTLSAVFAALILTMSLAGCNNDTPNSGSSSSNSNSSTSTSSSAEESKPQDSSSDNTSDSAPVESNSSNSDTTSSSEPSGGNSGNDNPGEAGRAQKYVDTALAADEWGGLEFINSANMGDFPYDPGDEYNIWNTVLLKLTPDMVTDFCVGFSMMNVNPYKIAVAKPAKGSEDAVKACFETELENIRAQDWYPPTEPFAKGSVMGITNDGYYYFICHANGASVESYMIANA